MSDEPLPVEIISPKPMPVEVVDGHGASAAAQPSLRIQRQSTDPSVQAKTTFQEDLTTAGQRRVNLIWEYTQAAIALLVVVTTMLCGGIGMYKDMQIPTIISVAFGMITGFYFSRTNHEKVGGMGFKPTSHYEGR